MGLGDKMKNIKKMLFSLLLAVFCGACCGRVVYGIYDKKLVDDVGGDKLYLVQAGAYSSYDNMVSKTNVGNYVYFEDSDGMYKSIVGITGDSGNIEKIKNTYGGDVLVVEYYSNDRELNDKIREYDLQMKAISDGNGVKGLVDEMLALYKGKNTTLVQLKS